MRFHAVACPTHKRDSVSQRRAQSVLFEQNQRAMQIKVVRFRYLHTRRGKQWPLIIITAILGPLPKWQP